MSILDFFFPLDFENSPSRGVQVDPVSLSKTDQRSKESNLQKVSPPRPKRGRRRTDDALLRDWSFASPPPPPPPPPPPSESPTFPLWPSPVFPLRRPRGRPRLNPLPEGGDTDNIRPSRVAEGGDQASAKKRKRCRNRKYQNGEYITDKEKEANRENEESFVDEVNIETGKDKYFVLGELGSWYNNILHTQSHLNPSAREIWQFISPLSVIFKYYLSVIALFFAFL